MTLLHNNKISSRDKDILKQIRDCYYSILNRQPDEEGLNHYFKLIQKNEIDVEKLQNILRNSEEYKVLKWRNYNTTKNPPTGNFFIKENYLHRLKRKYFDDVTNEKDQIIWQPYVYSLAEYLGNRLECTHIIDIGCGNAQKLVSLYPKFEIIGMDFEENLTKCKNN